MTDKEIYDCIIRKLSETIFQQSSYMNEFENSVKNADFCEPVSKVLKHERRLCLAPNALKGLWTIIVGQEIIFPEKLPN